MVKKLTIYSVFIVLLVLITGCSEEKSSISQSAEEIQGEEQTEEDERIPDFALIENQDQFGGEPFTELDIGDTQKTEIFQSNGYLYVYTPYTDEGTVLLSIADLSTEKWIVKDKDLQDLYPDISDLAFERLNGQHTLKWNVIETDDDPAKYLEIGKDGNLSDTLYDGKDGSQWPHLIPSNEKAGYTYYQFEEKAEDNITASKLNLETKKRIRVENGGEYVPGYAAFQLQNNLIVVQDDSDVKQLYDLEAGSLLFDESGKELEIGGDGTATTSEILTEGENGVLWMHSSLPASNDSIQISSYEISKKTQPFVQRTLDINVSLEANNEYGSFLSVVPYPSEDKIYFFKPSNFNGKASLMSESYYLPQAK